MNGISLNDVDIKWFPNDNDDPIGTGTNSFLTYFETKV